MFNFFKITSNTFKESVREPIFFLMLFAALVLIAAVAGKANAMTAMGAAIFFWGRVAYAVIYVAGIAWLRTAAWFVSVIGMVLIAIELLKAM